LPWTEKTAETKATQFCMGHFSRPPSCAFLVALTDRNVNHPQRLEEAQLSPRDELC